MPVSDHAEFGDASPGGVLEHDMAKAPRKQRTDAAAANRRWRERQARRIQLVTVEVGEATLDRLVAAGLVPAAAREDSARLGVILSRLLELEKLLASHVTDHGAQKSQAGHGIEAWDPITSKTGAHCRAALSRKQAAHL
jgi:hypothetical protein